MPRQTRFWVTLGIIALILLVFLFGGKGLWETGVLRHRVSDLEAGIDSLQRVNELMRKKLEALKSLSPQAIEEEARGLGMVKPGEKVYLLKPESQRKDK